MNNDWYKYELQVIDEHRKKHLDIWHWSVIPEEILFESGYIHNFNQTRLNRLYHKNGKIQDYGFDGMSKSNENYF